MAKNKTDEEPVEMLETQPYHIHRNKRIEAARAKIENPTWTISKFRDHLESLTINDNEWDKVKYRNGPTLSKARAKTEIAKIATEMGFSKKSGDRKRLMTFKAEPTKASAEAERRKAEIAELKALFKASKK